MSAGALLNVDRYPERLRDQRIGSAGIVWTLIGLLMAVDMLLLPFLHMSIELSWTFVIGFSFLLLIARAYRERSPLLSHFGVVGAQLVLFSYCGALLTYLGMAATTRPYADALLSAADAALGLDWRGWFDFVQAHPTVHFVLGVAYGSIPLQGLPLIAYFCHADRRRVDEFLLSAILAIILIVPIMMLLPCVAAWSQHAVDLPQPWRHDIIALRTHSMTKLADFTGIVTCPSYHTVLAVLLTVLARGLSWFPIVCALNLAMIISVPSEGAHYFVDIPAGVAVALICIACTEFLMNRGFKSAPWASASASKEAR